MEQKNFKKILNESLISHGFSKKGSYYYLFFSDITIVIGLQKSNFDNGYFINIGYIISQFNPSLVNPRDVDGDVRARFSFEKEGKRLDFFNLENIEEDHQEFFRNYIEDNIKHYISPVNSLETLKKLLQLNPVMLYQTKLNAKKVLGFE